MSSETMDQKMGNDPIHCTRYVIVGGGVSAVCCAEELCSTDPSGQLTVISSTPVLKAVTNPLKIGQLTESFDITEQSADAVFQGLHVKFLCALVVDWEWQAKTLVLDNGQRIEYDKLCIATGGRPKVICNHPLAIAIRDTQTIDRLQMRIKDSKRVLVVGNGGIATEIVYELKNVEIIWAIRHASISATFFDEGAAEFFKPMLLAGSQAHSEATTLSASNSKQLKIAFEDGEISNTIGHALGPYWAQNADVSGRLKERSVHVIYSVEPNQVISAEEARETSDVQKSRFNEPFWPLYVQLTDGQVIGCDLLIEATGVQPNSDLWAEKCDQLVVDHERGIVVNDQMQSSVVDVYACGDVCTAGWKWAKHWLQMRLWTQARQMGAYCGRAMVMQDISLDFCFELFTHVTKFFGFKIIFLGRFNAEGIEKPWYVLLRITKNHEYVKLIVQNGRIQGAVLIGETDLEDTIENLILNQIDISDLEEGLLDPGIDIADYFD